MKKIILSTILCGIVLNANSNVYVNSGIKDYSNSKTKVDGITKNIGTTHSYKNSSINVNYLNDRVNRINPITKQPIEQLNVKKYNLNYKYIINDKINMKTSFIKIIDNLATTDQGKIYGIGSSYKIQKGLVVKADIYKSDYETFNVNQYDLSLIKGFKVGDFKSKATLILKSINLDGDKYGTYTFIDKNYTTIGMKLNSSYNNFLVSVGAFFGKRIFTVLNDGQKVQHHAMEQDKTYMLSFGKKFNNFDLMASYSYQNGKELPENKDDVDTKVTSLMLRYKF